MFLFVNICSYIKTTKFSLCCAYINYGRNSQIKLARDSPTTNSFRKNTGFQKSPAYSFAVTE